MFQLAHVSFPGMFHKHLQRLRSNALDLLVVRLVERFQECIGKKRYIFNALGKAWQLKRKNLKTMVQILTELIRLYLCFEINCSVLDKQIILCLFLFHL